MICVCAAPCWYAETGLICATCQNRLPLPPCRQASPLLATQRHSSTHTHTHTHSCTLLRHLLSKHIYILRFYARLSTCFLVQHFCLVIVHVISLEMFLLPLVPVLWFFGCMCVCVCACAVHFMFRHIALIVQALMGVLETEVNTFFFFTPPASCCSASFSICSVFTSPVPFSPVFLFLFYFFFPAFLLSTNHRAWTRLP